MNSIFLTSPTKLAPGEREIQFDAAIAAAKVREAANAPKSGDKNLLDYDKAIQAGLGAQVDEALADCRRPSDVTRVLATYAAKAELPRPTPRRPKPSPPTKPKPAAGKSASVADFYAMNPIAQTEYFRKFGAAIFMMPDEPQPAAGKNETVSHLLEQYLSLGPVEQTAFYQLHGDKIFTD